MEKQTHLQENEKQNKECKCHSVSVFVFQTAILKIFKIVPHKKLQSPPFRSCLRFQHKTKFDEIQ
jgi:hypothetical protein